MHSIEDGVQYCRERGIRDVGISINYRANGHQIGTFDSIVNIGEDYSFTDLSAFNIYFDDAPPMPMPGSGMGEFNDVTRRSRKQGSCLQAVLALLKLISALEEAGIAWQIRGWDVQPALEWWRLCVSALDSAQ